MLTIARFGLAFVVGVATYFFMFWLPFSLLSFLPGHLLLALVGSLAAAIWAARYVWRRTEHGSEGGLLALTFGGAITVGAARVRVRILRPDDLGARCEPRPAARHLLHGAAWAFCSAASAGSSTGSFAVGATLTRSRAYFITGTVFCSEKPRRSTSPSVATALSPRETNAASSRTAMPRLPAVSIKREWPDSTSGRASATTTFDLPAFAAAPSQREPLVAAGLDDGPIAHERHRTPCAQMRRNLVAQRQHVELLGRTRDAHARPENAAVADLRIREQRKTDLQRLAWL